MGWFSAILAGQTGAGRDTAMLSVAFIGPPAVRPSSEARRFCQCHGVGWTQSLQRTPNIFTFPLSSSQVFARVLLVGCRVVGGRPPVRPQLIAVVGHDASWRHKWVLYLSIVNVGQAWYHSVEVLCCWEASTVSLPRSRRTA